MASSSTFLPLGICFLVLFHGSFAQLEQVTSLSDPVQREWEPQRQQRFRTECRIERLNAQEPRQRIESEAGFTEFWDQNEEQFQCAGVAALRHTIRSRGLLLPSFNNAPQLVYVVRGSGIHGAVFPGCAETFQSERGSQYTGETGGRGDQHQKVRRLREGDILALPAGVSHWIFNYDRSSDLVLVSLVDVGNFANQLDQNFRKSFLAGRPQREIVTGGRSQREWESPRREERGTHANNLLGGFDTRIVADSFNVDERLARRLQSQEDTRGAIVRVEGEFEVLTPLSQEEEQRREPKRSYGDNGLEETFCTMRLRHNINDPARTTDIYNPRGGRLSSVNSYNLPILHFLQLSAEHGRLYPNGIYTPHWNINAHSIVYITRGNGQLQIVNEIGQNVFNGRVQQGQMIVVPQNFAVVKRASSQGLEWVSFKTNSNAKISQIAGRVSVLRAMPVDVVMNSYQLSREEAWRVKNNREEVSVFGSSRRQREMGN